MQRSVAVLRSTTPLANMCYKPVTYTLRTHYVNNAISKVSIIQGRPSTALIAVRRFAEINTEGTTPKDKQQDTAPSAENQGMSCLP